MRRLLVIFSVIFLSGCGIHQMNNNIEHSTELLQENTAQMEKTSSTIAENTREIQRSTDTMEKFQTGFGIFFFLALIFLFIPAYVLFNLYRKVLQGKKPFSKKGQGSWKMAQRFKDLFYP